MFHTVIDLFASEWWYKGLLSGLCYMFKS